MSSGIIIKEVFVSHVSVESIGEEIDRLEEDIAKAETRLYMLGCSTPRKVDDGIGGIILWEDYIQESISQLLDDYRNDIIKYRLLHQAKIGEIENDI